MVIGQWVNLARMPGKHGGFLKDHVTIRLE